MFRHPLPDLRPALLAALLVVAAPVGAQSCLLECPDVQLGIPYGAWAGGNPPAQALPEPASCFDASTLHCHLLDDWYSTTSALGTTNVFCEAWTLEGDYRSCIYEVTVYETIAPLAPQCHLFEFRTEDDIFGEIRAFEKSSLGDGETRELWGGMFWTVRSSAMLEEADNGALLHRTALGDVRLEIDVPISGGGSGEDAKAGLMIRESLDPWAPRAMAMWASTKGEIQFHVRPSAGEPGSFVASPLPLGEVDKIALETRGDTVAFSVSEDDGYTWQVLGSTPLEIDGPKLVGMAASADRPDPNPGPLTWSPPGEDEAATRAEDPEIRATTATYSEGDATYRISNLALCQPLGPQLDACVQEDFRDWDLAALGSARRVSARLSRSILDLSAAGSRQGDGADNVGFAYRPVTGDFFARLQLDGYGLVTGGEAKAAELMVRADLDADGVMLTLRYLPDAISFSPIATVLRRSQPGAALESWWMPEASSRMLMAIERRGDSLTARLSIDGGRRWYSSETWEADLPDTLLVGAAVDSADPEVAARASFENFALCSLAGEALPPCRADDFADEALDNAWAVTGVGNANQVTVTESSGVLELTADGATAFAGADNAGFVYRRVRGDFRFEVDLDAAGMVTGGAYRKAGLMVRSDLDPWAVRLLAQLVPYWNDGADTHLQVVARQERGSLGNLAVATDTVGVPRQLRLALERRGDVFEVQYSTDGGATWTTPSGGLDGTVALEMPATVLVGLDVVSNDISTPSAALFDDFGLCLPELSGCSGDDFEDAAVGAEWSLTGLGNANQVSVAELAGVLELTADGATAFAGADNAGFLYRQLEGDFRAEVSLDAEAMTTGGPYRKSGVMLRAGLDPWAVRLSAQLVPYWNDGADTHLQVVAREVPGGWGNIALVPDLEGLPRQLRLAVERRGDDVTVEYSTDGGANWAPAGTIELELPETVYLGLDVVSNDISVTASARFDDFVVCTEP